MESTERRAVYVQSQEEWDIVIKQLRPSAYYNGFQTYSKVCIDLVDGSYCSYGWFNKNDYFIISFQDWINRSTLSKTTLVRSILISVPKI